MGRELLTNYFLINLRSLPGCLPALPELGQGADTRVGQGAPWPGRRPSRARRVWQSHFKDCTEHVPTLFYEIAEPVPSLFGEIAELVPSHFQKIASSVFGLLAITDCLYTLHQLSRDLVPRNDN